MRQKLFTGFIFSVYQGEVRDFTNHNEVMRSLESDNVALKEIELQDDHKGRIRGFFIETGTDDQETLDKLKTQITTLCGDYNQDSFLELNEKRGVSQVFFNNNRIQGLGKFTTVKRSEALQHDNFAYDAVLDQYYVVV